MISLLLVDTKQDEKVFLDRGIHDIVAGYSDEYWNIECFSSKTDAVVFLEKNGILDFACIDITADSSMDLVKDIRGRYDGLALMLIADTKISPMEYLRPGVRPDSLLLRPLSEAVTEKTLLEFIADGMDRKMEKGEKDFFVVKSKDERTFIPYRDICYFEAREKKVFACTLYEEYGFYASLEEMSDSLPEEFIRCHRSFLVNSSKIVKIIGSRNMIELKDGLEVPVSRSYKTRFREYKG